MCRFLFMGVLIKRKGVHDLVEAVKNIAEQYPEKSLFLRLLEQVMKKYRSKN
ncbi:hypothetical protein LOS20_13480 [Enterococcus faecium]|nr:hypothetical protein [Enterococcus faecium]